MGRFSSWADRQGRRSGLPASRSIPEPPPEPVPEPEVYHYPTRSEGAIHPAQPRPLIISRGPSGQIIRSTGKRVNTCAVVRADPDFDGYADILASVPEIIDPRAPKTADDAMKASTPPDLAVMNKWTPTARRTYGSNSGPETDELLGPYGSSTSSVRTTNGAFRPSTRGHR